MEWTANELPVTANVKSEAEQLRTVFGTSKSDPWTRWTIRQVCVFPRLGSRGGQPPCWPRPRGHCQQRAHLAFVGDHSNKGPFIQQGI